MKAFGTRIMSFCDCNSYYHTASISKYSISSNHRTEEEADAVVIVV